MKNKDSKQRQLSDERDSVAGSWQLSQDEAKELERRQQVLQGLSELNRSDPGGARAIPDIVFHNISPGRQRQLAEEYPARNSQGASVGHLNYAGAIKEGLNDEEFATLESSFHAYTSLPAELQQKWQSDLRASKPDSDEYKSRKEYERAHTVWTAEGLCSLKKLAEEAQAAGYQHSESKRQPTVGPKTNPESKQQDVEPKSQPQSQSASKSKGEFQFQQQKSEQEQPKPKQEQPEPPAGSGSEGEGQSGATGEKQPEDDRQQLLRELHELGKQSDVDKNWLINATLSDNLSVDRQEQLYERHGRQRIAIEEQEDSSGVKLHHEIIPGQRSVNHGRAIMDSKSGYSDEEVRHALRIVDDFNKLSDQEKKSLIELASESAPVQGSGQSGKSYAKDRQEWASTVAELIQEKAEDMPNSADEKKNWDSIENRRAVVERLTMLGDAESAVVREAMAKSVYREYSLASLAFFESDGKASPSLEKRRDEIGDDLEHLERIVDISGKFSDSDTSTISKVISNFSHEQMDELDKLVDEVAILAEKDPQGMERLRSNVRERSHELADEVHETALSDSLSSKEYYKREADLVGNFYSSVITQAREAAEAVTKSRGEGQGQGSEQASATSQPEPAPQPRPEVNPSSGQEPEKEQPESPTGGEGKGEERHSAEGEKQPPTELAGAPNPAGEKNWDNIENRRAVVRRMTMLGDDESDVVQEAMLESVDRERFLAHLALLEPKGKARASLEKRLDELDDDLERTLNIEGKFSDSDTNSIFKVISNFSYEQMDDLDKLVDGVAILAEKDPQGMERLRSDVTQRRHELSKKVEEIRLSDFVSNKEYCKLTADLVGNSHSRIIAQTREAAEAVTGKSKPKQSSATSQPEPAPQPRPEVNPSSGQESEKEQPESPTGGEKGRDTIEDRREMAERLRTLDSESKKLIGLCMHDFEREAESGKNGVQRMVMPSAESVVDKLSETADDLKPEQVSELNYLIDEVATLKAEDPQKLTKLAKKAQQEFDEVVRDVDDWSTSYEITHDVYAKEMGESIKKIFRSTLKSGLHGEFISASWRLPVHPPSGSSESPSEGGLAGEKEISPEDLPKLREDMSKYVGEQVLNDKMRSELLKQAFIRPLGQERMAELQQQYGGEVNSAAEMIVKSIQDADGLNGKECYRLNELLKDLDALPDSEIRRVIRSGTFRRGMTSVEDAGGDQDKVSKAYFNFSAKLEDLIHRKAERIRQTGDLRLAYQNSSRNVRLVTSMLVNRDRFSRYSKSSNKDRGDMLLGQLGGKAGDNIYDALMSKDGINFLSNNEVASYRKHLAMVKDLSADSLDKLLDFDNDLRNLKDGVVPLDIKIILARYQDGKAPGKLKDRQKYNQAQARLYRMEMKKLGELAQVDREKSLALRRKLTGQIFNRNVYEGARSLLYTELMMKSFSKERYEEVMETFRDGERTQFGDFIQCHNASEPGVPDPRGMTQEEFERLAELTPLVLGLSKSQVKQLLESEEKEKTRLSKGDPNDPELWQKRQQYSATLEQRIRRMVRDNDAENINMASVDRSRIVEMKAYIDAKRKLDKELTPKPEDLNAKGKLKLGARVRGAVARLWKGKIFRDYYEFKYQRELKEQYSKDFAHTLGVNSGDGSASSAETEQALIWRMTQDSDFFTDTVGEEREQLSPDSEAYKAMRQAVETFVENGNEEAFVEETRRINNDLMGNEGMPVLDNYLTSAIYIKGQVDHGRALNDVMRGFKMYQGTSAEGVNSGHHERAIDKLVAKFERKKTGWTLSIKPEAVAGVAGLASWIGGAVARNRAVQAVSFGGSAVVAGVLAGVKENEQVKIDRADLARRIAEGGQVDEDNKYEMELAETLPEMRTAESYMEAMDQAIASGDADRMRQVLADLVVAREVGRNEGVDLIDYYSGGGDAEVVRNELTSRQFALEQAYIRTNKDPNLELGRYKDQLMDGLSAATQAYGAVFPDVNGALLNWDNVPENVREQIIKAYEMQAARDRVAKKLRRRRVAKEWAVTTARTLAFSTIGQEIAAGFRSDVHGAFEDMLFGQHGDAPGAARTALGNLLNTPNGGVVGEVVAGGNQPEKQFYREGEINQDQIKQWQAEGYKVEKHFDYEPHSVQGTVSAEEAVRSNITVHRSGWADNLTGRIDGNELAGHHTDIATQYAFQPGGGATGMGFAISRSEIFDAGQDGQVELWLSPTRGTQANPFKIIGHVVDNQIVFDAEPGSEAAEMLANKSYALAEVVHAKSGFVMSTEVGSGTADSFIRTAKEMVNTLTGYDITPPVDRVISSVPVTPDVEPLPPVPGYRGTRRLSADDELFERPARAETAPEEEVNPPTPTPSSGGSSGTPSTPEGGR